MTRAIAAVLMTFLTLCTTGCFPLVGPAASTGHSLAALHFVQGGPPPEPMDFQLTGPYVCGNLSLYLVHRPDSAPSHDYLTLAEAMDRDQVVVDETRSVNCLSIHSRSSDDLFVQAGEIVKGGQQDRTLADDLIVSSHDSTPVRAFCVEHGRWTARDNESGNRFATSRNALVSRELKLAARLQGDQSGVWNSVELMQESLARCLHAPVASERSPTSLQLTIENPTVQRWAGEYAQSLQTISDLRPDAVGYVCIINGQLSSADIYASRALFRKLWPKLLMCSAIEAIGRMQESQGPRQASIEEVRKLLAFRQVQRTALSQINERTTALGFETDHAALFETRDNVWPDRWVHRCYLTK